VSADSQADPRRIAAQEFARTLAGGDDATFLRLFVAAYNLAYEAAPIEGEEPAASAQRAMVTRSLQPPDASSALRLLTTSEGAHALSVFDDPAWIENSKHVLDDSSRILNGVPTQEFPDCVAVGSPSTFCCTGTLIAPHAVLTAAHCAGGCSDRVFFGPRVVPVEEGRLVSVNRVVVHPDYAPPTPYDDLAILLLAEQITDVAPRMIASADAAELAGSVRLVGYGTTEPTGVSGYGEKRRVDVPMASADPRFGARPETEFVAGAPFLDLDSCPGDSGGPAYVEAAGQWLLAGATSRGTIGASRPCGDGGVYTRVAPYVPWIESVIGMSLAT
jgi:secreted trypsin-like serine protease